MLAIEEVVQEAITAWNDTLTQEGFQSQIKLDLKCRKKKFYINRNESYEKRIAELSLYQTGTPTLLLYRKELVMPEKVANTTQHAVDEEYRRSLFKYLFYEALGNFCHTTSVLIQSKDYAEYDIENDRLKAHESGDGMIIQTIEDGPFYAKKCEFDVFMVADDGYWVFTAHDLAKPNNGIAKVLAKHAMVTNPAKIKILTL
jgi:hypothetical protein